jgi:hypothetical protein
MTRAALLLSTAVLVALAVAPTVNAGKPTTETTPLPADFIVSASVCGFPVLVHSEGRDGIVTSFSDEGGNVVRQILVFPGNSQSFTNLITGESIAVPTSGPGFWQFNPDDSSSLTGTGPWTWIPNPVTGDPGIFYTTGRFVATFDPAGNQTSFDLTGRIVDLCAEISP